jgi:quinohemoprotein amine dehydrogenase
MTWNVGSLQKAMTPSNPFLFRVWFTLPLLLAASIASAADAPNTPKPPSEEGIPVTNKLVIAKCSGCHRADAKGNLSRISWIRTTPEGWEQALKRMVRLNGLQVTPQEARDIVQYLSATHGLAPAEALEVRYMSEHRLVDETVPDDVKEVCNACHAAGVPKQWRRSKEEWELLAKMHLGYFAVAEFEAFLRPPDPPDAPPPAPNADKRQPVDKAMDYWAKTNTLQSPEWSEWQASMRTPKLTGRWLISGSQPGKGPFFGEMSVEPGGGDSEFTTHTKITFPRDGSTEERSGKSLVYTGYAWRGKSVQQGPVEGVDAAKDAREVMFVSRDQNSMDGRWFWGQYQEFGMDVKAVRAGSDIAVSGVDVTHLRAASKDTTVHIYGDNFPADLSEGDLDLGSGVKVTKIVSRTPNVITATVDVDSAAITGRRDVAVRRAVATSSYAVYDHIDYLKVAPEWSMARLGTERHPKGYFQFEAVAFANGPDGKPNTGDDINLGTILADWSMEEFYATYGDDDTNFVGKLDPKTGLFTPNADGPSPKRKFARNNYGDVWVVATVKGIGKNGKDLTAKSYLIVTVPKYASWDQPEVAPPMGGK